MVNTTTGTQPLALALGCRGVSITQCRSVNAAFLFVEPRMLVVEDAPSEQNPTGKSFPYAENSPAGEF